ncbi:hypothetical protein [Flavobacterium daejeonense]|uniref:hypothetical protein n=1 Tax=Flavobacterium daejeonense TaxID=350893 RepID=UPI00047B104A|nr:hypothetical protein [Flavobacterium daejeonense]
MENNPNQIIPEKIHLTNIKWIKENTVVLDDKLPQNPIYNFTIAHNVMHNLEKQLVKIRLFVDMDGRINEKSINQGGDYEIDFFFQIEDLKNHYQLIEDKAVFNGVFVGTLLGISFSTLRGILFAKWKDTVLESVLLPVISIPSLLNSKR